MRCWKIQSIAVYALSTLLIAMAFSIPAFADDVFQGNAVASLISSFPLEDLSARHSTSRDSLGIEARQVDWVDDEMTAMGTRFANASNGVSAIDFVRPGWSTNIDYLNWTMQRRGLDFAIPTTDTALAVGVGQVQNLDFRPDSGFRTSLGYLTATGWEITFRYTSFDTAATATAADMDGNLWATRAHPDRGEEADTANAFGNFDYDVFDLEMQRWVMLHKSTSVGIFGGFRWADISQNLRVEYDGRDFDQAVVLNPVDMTGFGLRMGGEGHWQISRGLSLFGRAAGTIMQGNFKSQLVETNFDGADLVVDVTDAYTNTLTAIELAAGVSWQHGPFGIATGYEMIDWSNLGERTTFSSATHEGAYDPSSVDVLLEGLFVRGTLVF